MRRRVLGKSHASGRINVTPMIDVVMVLIVFYLIVGNLVAEQVSDLRLPPSRSGRTQKTQDLLVINILPRVDNEAPIEIEGLRVTTTLLPGLIRDRIQQKPETAVQVRADQTLTYADVLPVIQACREAGIPHVRISAEQVTR